MDENLAQGIIAGTAQVILVLNRAGKVVSANQSARRLLGDVVGRAWLELLDPFSQDKGGLLLTESWAAGSAQDWELDHLISGDNPILLRLSTFVLKDADLLALVGEDQTEKLELTSRLAATNQQLEGALLGLEQAHAELKRAQAQLVQSEKMRALGQVVAGVAHEINTPAAFVANNLAHLGQLVPALHALYQAYAPLRTRADREQTAAIERAEAAADIAFVWQDLADIVQESRDGMGRIRDIVLSLRNFARLDEAQLKEADINEGLRSTLRLVRPLCQSRIRIVEKYAELPLLLCRPGELNQVFLNLLTNAVQAIPGDGEIRLETIRTPAHVVVRVQDTGQGMDPTTIARLGEPFFTTKPVGVGTGLGLAVSFGIIERHRGRLDFESAAGKGTTVTLQLPITEGQQL